MKILLINNNSRYIEKLHNILKPNNVNVINFDQISLNDAEKYDTIVLSGSPRSPDEKDFVKEVELVKKTKVPVLGICFGFQLICYAYGDKLEKLPALENEVFNINIIKPDKIVGNINSLNVYQNHEYSIKKTKLLIPIAKSDSGLEIIKHPNKMIYGFQFHPEEINKKTNNKFLVDNFLNICKNT